MITRASGTVDSELLFKQFTVGFTTGMASFDFIDVGKGKERADTKIKGTLLLEVLWEGNCSLISFGRRGYSMAFAQSQL